MFMRIFLNLQYDGRRAGGRVEVRGPSLPQTCSEVPAGERVEEEEEEEEEEEVEE